MGRGYSGSREDSLLWMFMWERGAQEQGLCLQTPEPLPDQLQNCSWSGKKKRVSHLLDMEEGGGVGRSQSSLQQWLFLLQQAGGYSLVEVHGLLIALASLVAELRL